MVYLNLKILIVIIALTPQLSSAIDLLAPSISLSAPAAESISANTVRISAKVQDDRSLSSVKLFYRTLDSNDAYVTIKMTRQDPNESVFNANISEGYDDLSGIEYFVEAEDSAHNISQEPFPSTPKKLNLDQFRKLHQSKLQPRQNIRYGISLNQGHVSVDDPEGGTIGVDNLSLSAYIQFQIATMLSIRMEADARHFVLPYDESHIGQEVTSRELNATVNYPYSVYGKTLWLGAGFAFVDTQIRDRATQSNDFVNQSYPNRSLTDVSLMLISQLALFDFGSSQIGLNAKWHKSFNNGVNTLEAGIAWDF